MLAQLDEVATRAKRTDTLVKQKREEWRAAREQFNAILAEYRDLERVYKRYANAVQQGDLPPAPEPAPALEPPGAEVPIGATEAILAALRTQQDRTMRRDRLIEHLARLREGGLIKTDSKSDSQKLFGSFIGNMLRQPSPKIKMNGDQTVRLVEAGESAE